MARTKPKILKILHLANILWLQLEATKISIKSLYTIIRSIDKGYPEKEGLIGKEQDVKYSDLIGDGFYQQQDWNQPDPEGCYSLTIFGKDKIEFIIFKSHPLFAKVEKLVFKYFDITKENTK